MKKLIGVLAVLGMVLVAGCGGNAEQAQAPAPTEGAAAGGTEEASGAGEESFEEIEAAAKAEGGLVWYAGASAQDMQKIADQFMSEYPEIKIEIVSLNADQVPARLAVEQRSGLYNADIVSASGWPMNQAERQDALEAFHLPDDLTQDMQEGSIDPDGYWVAEYVLTFPIVYNTDLVASLGLEPPTSYWDLTKPEWKGRFGMTPDNFEWYASLEKAYGEQEALELLEALAANQPVMRDGSTLNLELLQAGEFAASIHVYGYRADRVKADGAPVDYVNVEPVITVLQPQSIARNAPHPNAAKLFQMWIIKEDTQKFIVEATNRTSAHTKAVTAGEVWNPDKYEYFLSDPQSGEDYGKYQDIYESTFGLK